MVEVAKEAVPQPTREELEMQLGQALAAKDYSAVAKVSAKLSRFQADIDKAEREAKEKALADITNRVKSAIEGALKRFIDRGDLNGADGVWYSYDFGDTLSTCRVLKPTATKTVRHSNGGAGKKFDVKTEDMLTRHGAEVWKDGITYQAQWDSSTEKNNRFGVRTALLKLEGFVK